MSEPVTLVAWQVHLLPELRTSVRNKGVNRVASDLCDQIAWRILRFGELSTRQLHDVLRLRCDVFVVEQACVYPEIDGLDILEDTVHVLGSLNSELLVYARAMSPTADSREATIGRVVTASSARGRGLAKELMIRLMVECRVTWPGHGLALSAQTQVRPFYESLGFVSTSSEYLEDGIPHIDMVLQQL